MRISGTFPPEDADTQQLSFSVDIIDDMIVESTENLLLSLSSDDLAVIVNDDADQVDLAIPDNDGMYMFFFYFILFLYKNKLSR